MIGTSQELSQNSIQIKQDGKFYSKILSKESSLASPSIRVYYGGGAGAVPFMWESQPGTPKCSFNETTLPPLTPPPSYYFNSNYKNPIKKNSRSNSLLHILFPKMNMLKKNDHHVPSSPSSTSFSSNSSWSSSSFSMVVPITSPKKYHHQRVRSRFSSTGSSFDSRADYEEAEAIGSPTSTLWFNRIKVCYGW